MKFWQTTYFNKTNWILDNQKILDLTMEELIVLLYINFFLEHNIFISPQSLSEYSHLDIVEVNKALELLTAKGYLEMKLVNNKVTFSIENIFEYENSSDDLRSIDLFQLFEKEFGRPLSSNEWEYIKTWNKDFKDEYIIIEALREALVQNKLSFSYINQILYSRKRNNNEEN